MVTDVQLGDAIISISIPLRLNIPAWFDADMDISIEVEMGLGEKGTVFVGKAHTNVHISRTWVPDLAGCTEFGTKIAQASMTEIVNNQLVPGISAPLADQVEQFRKAAQENDPLHRIFVLSSLA